MATFEQGLTIAEAARTLGVSAKTVRRLIKAGKVSADLVEGPFGQEYRIREMPSTVGRGRGMDSASAKGGVLGGGQGGEQLLDMLRELQEKNLALAAQLGMAHERIRTLEGEMKALSAGKVRPWWKRLFGRGR